MDQSVQVLLQGMQYKKLFETKVLDIQEKYNLRKVDIEVLYYLAQCGKRDTARDIREEMSLTKGHISQAVDRLQKMNILELVPDKEDRRYVHLYPTAYAKTLMAEIMAVWEELNQTILEGITEEEKQVLKNVALKIRNNLKKELKESK